jgi:hypothetical protein
VLDGAQRVQGRGDQRVGVTLDRAVGRTDDAAGQVGRPFPQLVTGDDLGRDAGTLFQLVLVAQRL